MTDKEKIEAATARLFEAIDAWPIEAHKYQRLILDVHALLSPPLPDAASSIEQPKWIQFPCPTCGAKAGALCEHELGNASCMARVLLASPIAEPAKALTEMSDEEIDANLRANGIDPDRLSSDVLVSAYKAGFNECRCKAMNIVDEHEGFLNRIESLEPDFAVPVAAPQPVIDDAPMVVNKRCGACGLIGSHIQGCPKPTPTVIPDAKEKAPRLEAIDILEKELQFLDQKGLPLYATASNIRRALHLLTSPAEESKPLPSEPAEGDYEKTKRCCTVCDARKKCHVCDAVTDLACSDCRINFGVTIYVCSKRECRNAHEVKCYGDGSNAAKAEKVEESSDMRTLIGGILDRIDMAPNDDPMPYVHEYVDGLRIRELKKRSVGGVK
jgi:hypothetical protein